MTVPDPPRHFDPHVTTWPAGSIVYRVHDQRYEPLSFFAGGRGRFHPVSSTDGEAAIPVLYVADSWDGAFGETVFRDTPLVAGPKTLPAQSVENRLLSTLFFHRAMLLANFTAHGLKRLGVDRSQLIDTYPTTYTATAAWAAAVHRHPLGFDGILWVSRQFDRSHCLVLFGDRADGGIGRVARSPSLPLAYGLVLDRILELADQADITITGLA